MKKLIVTLVIVVCVSLIVAYRKPIGKFLSGSDTKQNDDKSGISPKVKAAMIVAAEKANEKVKEAAKKAEETVEEVKDEAAKIDAEKDKPEETEVMPEEKETPWLEGYDSETRIMKIGGAVYNIPSVDALRNVQANLIEGFEYLADAAVTPSPFNPITRTATQIKPVMPIEARPTYRQIVDDMIAADTTNMPKTGIDGKLNKATAVAFAECVRIMPGVVEKYRMEM